MVPHLSSDFFCIVDRDNIELAAVISSYLASYGTYIPFFEYPTTTIGKVFGDDTTRDKHEMSRRRAYLFGRAANNAFSQMNGTENLILAGLSAEQRSFLTLDYPDVNIIDVPDVQTAEFALSAFSGKKKILPCRPSEVLTGLYVALKFGWVLRIDEMAIPIVQVPDEGGGLIVLEAIPSVGSVIAVNYACVVGADMRIVDALVPGETDEIKYCIEQWKGAKRKVGAGEHERAVLEEKVNSRVGMVDFSKYSFCTFFTCGLPYSTILGNVAKFSYVNMLWRMDRFLMNAILSERERRAWSAVVFSPQKFGEMEETTTAIAALSGRNHYVKSLLGRAATAFNLNSHVEDYPYDLLHICSHGGDVEGEYCSFELEYSGVKHKMEFDLVRSFHFGGPGIHVPITTKMYWRRFDEKDWGSPRYQAEGGIDPELFIRFREQLECSDHNGEIHGTVRTVPDSSCVRCVDFPFLGMFEVCAAGYLSPFVFNNSCWSGYEMAEPFVEGGARGYIGTLWSVNTVVAAEVGQDFYQNVFGSTILEAFYSAVKKTIGKGEENVYIYWGLHFSTISVGEGAEKTGEKLAMWLTKRFIGWIKKSMYHENREVRVNSFRKARWIRLYVLSEFGRDISSMVRFAVKER